jgi:hypothetical protein
MPQQFDWCQDDNRAINLMCSGYLDGAVGSIATVHRHDELLRSHSALQAFELRQTTRNAGS